MKNFVTNGLAGLSVLLSLMACGTEVKSVEYYREHLDEAKAVIAECNKLKEWNKDQERNCGNATQARHLGPK